MSAKDIEDFFICPKCGRRNVGFARCQTPGCGELRKEFREHERVVVGEIGPCGLSGSPTDVRLPNGDYLWAPYFLGHLEGGWLDESYSYTEAFYAIHTYRKPGDDMAKQLAQREEDARRRRADLSSRIEAARQKAIRIGLANSADVDGIIYNLPADEFLRHFGEFHVSRAFFKKCG